MIFRPVRPGSRMGRPVTNRPVGLMWKTHRLVSRSSAGIVGRMTCWMTSSRICWRVTSGLCCAETTTVSTERGLSSTYRTVTWLLPSGLRDFRTPVRRASLGPRAERVPAHGDVRRLLVDRRDDAAGLVVEAVLGAGVTHLLDRLAGDPRNVHVAGGRDLPRHHPEA